MFHFAHFSMCALAFVGLALPLAGDSDRQPLAAEVAGQNSPARSCAAKVAGLYGFQCYGSAAPVGVLEPVTFIGTVKGTEDGFYEGYGTFSIQAQDRCPFTTRGSPRLDMAASAASTTPRTKFCYRAGG
jgi:hypothetical protein